jgi:flagellin-like hook-associated protein FlgL
MRINKASDDAAGLAIALSLNSDTRVFTQAVRNLNDGISYLSIASGALDALSTIVIRQKELAEQSANGTVGLTQRKSIQQESDALTREYARITATATFNNRKIYEDNSNNLLSLQTAYSAITYNLGQSLADYRGDGTFSSGTTVDSATFLGQVVIADLNNDGKQDIIQVRGTGGNLRYQLGNGDGTFQSVIQLSTGNSPISVLVDDYNKDGFKDFAIVNSQGNLRVALQNSNGTFGTFVTYQGPLGANTMQLTSGDFDGDGITDLFYQHGSFTSWVLRGNSDGSFQAPVTAASTLFNSTVKVADFNNDGKSDLVSITSGTLRTFTSNGDGTFAVGATIFSGITGSVTADVGDFNRDGIQDIVYSDTTSGRVYLAIGNANGTFQASISFTSSGANPGSITTGDYNGDGLADISYLTTGSTSLSIRLGNGDGSFRAETSSAISTNGSFAFGDVNNDGSVDLVSVRSDSNSSALYLQGTRTEFQADYLYLLDQKSARNAIDQLETIFNKISQERSIVGASLSRISVGIQTLSDAALQYKAAESRIRDIDVAEESSELTKQSIRQQVAASILGQANQQPSLALSLLRS